MHKTMAIFCENGQCVYGMNSVYAKNVQIVQIFSEEKSLC